MSTRAGIGIREEGYIRVVYCHSDGYPEYTGAILVEHYTTASKVKKLLALGALSLLGSKVEPSGTNHNFEYDSREAGVTVAYHRDRGDKKWRAKRISEGDFKKTGNIACQASYLYLYNVETSKWETYKCKQMDYTTGDAEWERLDVDYTTLRKEAVVQGWMQEKKRRVVARKPKGKQTTMGKAKNMFGEGLSEDVKRRIRAYLENPTYEGWDDIQGIVIRPRGTVATIWQSICAIDPTFPRIGRRTDDKGDVIQEWERIPDPVLVMRAIKEQVE